MAEAHRWWGLAGNRSWGQGLQRTTSEMFLSFCHFVNMIISLSIVFLSSSSTCRIILERFFLVKVLVDPPSVASRVIQVPQ